MAVRSKVDSKARTFGDNVQLVSWSGLLQTSADTGEAFECPGASDRSVQLAGTLGTGGVVVIEGSNLEAPNQSTANHWAQLKDPQGNAITLDAIGKIAQISEITRWIRPRCSAGDGSTNLEVRLVARRP